MKYPGWNRNLNLNRLLDNALLPRRAAVGF